AHGSLIATARFLLLETTFFAFCKGRKRNWLMAMKTENSAILLFRFDYHFLFPCLGKVGSTQACRIPCLGPSRRRATRGVSKHCSLHREHDPRFLVTRY